jgi:cytochrome c oxidase cbb3-type subunit 1
MTGPADMSSASGPSQAEDDRALAAIFSASTVSATFWLVVATAVGLLVAVKFIFPDFATRL